MVSHFLRRSSGFLAGGLSWAVVLSGAVVLGSAAFPAAASAEVVRKAPEGFVVRAVAEVNATPATAWQELIVPAGWWNPRHSFSGDASHLTLTPRAGGCFCEVLPQGEGTPGEGGVEHLRVIYVEPGRVLRLSGGLGPLQSEAVNGVWTITLKSVGAKTRILFEYIVGGYMRYTSDEIAPVVDKVLTEQLGRLAARFGSGKAPVPAVTPEVAPAPAMRPVSQKAPVPAAIAYSLPAKKPASPEAAPDHSTPVEAKPQLTSLPAARYVERRFAVSKDGAGFLLAEAGDGGFIRANFASPGLLDSFRKAFDGTGAGNGASNGGGNGGGHGDGEVWCTCMGSFAEDGSAFSIVAAQLGG